MALRERLSDSHDLLQQTFDRFDSRCARANGGSQPVNAVQVGLNDIEVSFPQQPVTNRLIDFVKSVFGPGGESITNDVSFRFNQQLQVIRLLYERGKLPGHIEQAGNVVVPGSKTMNGVDAEYFQAHH